MTQNTGAFEALLQEDRTYPPPADFAAHANIADPAVYEEARRDPEAFWARFAGELDWFQPWDTVLDWSDAPFAKWFVGGKLNAAYNCIDRHLDGPRKNKAAIIWEGEPGDWQVYTYRDLYREVCKFANGLKSLGVQKGDRVTLYMPMVPELAIAMLACARIGAPHSIVFGGFSAESLRDRIEDSQSKVMITADGGWRRGNIIPLKQNADASIEGNTPVEKVVVVKRTAHDIPMVEGRDVWWHDLVADQPLTCEPEHMDSEDMLFMLYTSGTTGKPKGIVHTTGGYMTGTYATTKWIFDLKEDDVYWCTADIGWVTGHSYIIYGPLANGATTVMYEGSPDYPDRDRFWAIVEKYACTICYTAPTAIRTFMRWGEEYPNRRDMSSLRLLGSVGEPINPRPGSGTGSTSAADAAPGDTWWQTKPAPHDLRPARHHHPQARLGDPTVPRHRRRHPRRAGQRDRTRRRWLPCRPQTLAQHSAASTATPNGSSSRLANYEGIYFTSEAPSSTRNPISGSSAAWTTSSTCRPTASAPWRSSPRWWTT